MFFANEFSKATALEGARCDDESLTEWRGRMVHKAGVWYYEHLGGQKPVVIVTEDDNLLKQVVAPVKFKRISKYERTSYYTLSSTDIRRGSCVGSKLYKMVVLSPA